MYRPGHLSALLLLATTTLVPVFGSVAHAQDAQAITPEQTQSLAHALGIYEADQMASVFGPGTDRITPEGDHYLVKMPLSQGRDGGMLTGDDVTMHAKPLDENRWTFDTITLPGHLVIGDKGAASPVDVTLATTGLTYSATVDNTNATPGTSDLTLESMNAHVTQKAKTASDTDTDLTIAGGAGEAHGTTTAAVDGRVDEASKVAFSNLTITTAGASPVHFTMGKVLGDLMIGGVSPEQTRAFTAATNKFSQESKATTAAPVPAPADGTTPPKPALTDEQKATIKDIIASARDMLHTVNFTEEADDISVSGTDNTTVKMDKVRLATIGAAPDGKLDAREEITVDGLSVDAPGMGAAGSLIPHHVVFTPHVAGLPLDDVTAVIEQYVDNPNADSSVMETAFGQMVAKGPIHISIDQLAFDMGPATIESTAVLDVTSPSPAANAITADIKATGLDDLMKVLSADPQLKQGVAVVVFIKGIGKQDGNTVTWHVVFKDGKLLVNGTDMSQMIPH